MDAKQGGTTLVPQYSEYQVARSIDSFRGDLGMKSFPEVLQIFWETHLEEVREACTDSFARRSENAFLGDDTASWCEKYIPMVFESEVKNRNYCHYWDRLLAAYLFNFNYQNSRVTRTKVRALELAIALFFSEKGKDRILQSADLHSSLSKMIAGAIRKYPELYWAPSVPEFLEHSLAHENWTIRERAIELICLAEDTSFLERIAELSRKEKQAQEKTEDYRKKENVRGHIAGGKFRGFLEAASHLLLLYKTEEKSDIRKFEDEVAQTLQKIGKLSFKPDVRFSCPEQVPSDMGFSVLLNALPQYFFGEYAGGYVSDYYFGDLTIPVLKRCALWFGADGAEISNKETDPILHNQERCASFTTENTARFTILSSTRKTVRLTVTFVYQDTNETWQEGAKFTHYIRRAE